MFATIDTVTSATWTRPVDFRRIDTMTFNTNTGSSIAYTSPVRWRHGDYA
jgi:hypothetical protein